MLLLIANLLDDSSYQFADNLSLASRFVLDEPIRSTRYGGKFVSNYQAQWMPSRRPGARVDTWYYMQITWY